MTNEEQIEGLARVMRNVRVSFYSVRGWGQLPVWADLGEDDQEAYRMVARAARAFVHNTDPRVVETEPAALAPRGEEWVG